MNENNVTPSIAIAITLAVLFFAYSSIARSAEPPKASGAQYALFLNGGGDFELNAERFDRGLGSVYKVYREKGVPEKNLYVLSGSGHAEDARTDTLIVSGHSLPGLFDYDGDKKSDVKGAATKESLQKTFKELSKKMKPGDQLSLVITGPAQKDLLAGEVNLLLWGQSITPKDLKKYLDQLPAGTKKVIVTDVAFGGELTKIGDASTVVFSANDENASGRIDSGFLQRYAGVLGRDGATPLAAYHRALSDEDSGRNSISKYISEALLKQASGSKTSEGEICASCAISRLNAPESETSKKMRESARASAESLSVSELAEVVKKTRHQYFDGDLKFLADKEYSELLSSVQKKKKELSGEFAQNKSAWERARPSASDDRKRSEEKKAGSLRDEVKKVAAIEKSLIVQEEAVKKELTLILSGSLDSLETYSRMKKSAQAELHDEK